MFAFGHFSKVLKWLFLTILSSLYLFFKERIHILLHSVIAKSPVCMLSNFLDARHCDSYIVLLDFVLYL